MIDNIVLNIPHSSVERGCENWEDGIQQYIDRWTDWHTYKLFQLNSDERVKSVVFPYSRFYCDVERLIDDPLEAKGQGIVYREFEGLRRTVSRELETEAMAEYWKHQQKLSEQLNTNSLLIDCHSFPKDLSDVDICIGYNDDWSKPSDELLRLMKEHFEELGCKVAFNSPYSNSITPATDFEYKSVMIEVNKRLYLRDNNEMMPDSYKTHAKLVCLYNKILDTWKNI